MVDMIQDSYEDTKAQPHESYEHQDTVNVGSTVDNQNEEFNAPAGQPDSMRSPNTQSPHK